MKICPVCGKPPLDYGPGGCNGDCVPTKEEAVIEEVVEEAPAEEPKEEKTAEKPKKKATPKKKAAKKA